jgi:GTP cyclohydrolase I
MTPTPEELTAAYEVIIEQLFASSMSTAEVDNLKDSAERAARGLTEMMWPGSKIISEVTKALGTAFPVSDAASTLDKWQTPVFVGPIETHSLCPHHLLPIINRVHVGYVPAAQVIGLSKLPRIVDALARRAVVQEQYTQDIVDVLTTGQLAGRALAVQPLAGSVAVSVNAVHHCMTCRGVKGNARTLTEVVTGSFQHTNMHLYQTFSRFVDNGS